MTTNAFIFICCDGAIESIIPITEYEVQIKQELFTSLATNKRTISPLDNILRRLLVRSMLNLQREYHVYSIDCDISMDEKFWKQAWADDFSNTEKIIKARGHKII